MTPERHRRIVELFRAAAEKSPDARVRFLAQACGGDDNLCREVEAMFAAVEQHGGTVEASLADLAAGLTAGSGRAPFDRPERDEDATLLDDPPTDAPLSDGEMLGPYEILAPLGKGGMGEVYRALDRKLKREVAVKILPKAFTTNSAAIERLKREARLLASLNHPNIAAVYELQELEDQCFLVLELVPGKTLSRKLSRGPLAVREALSICRQVAAALEAAHERGVIHRDLKPANIMVTPESRVKLLDFGIASIKARPESGAESATQSQFTLPRTIMGTLAYMSPEQARGHRLDKRTDIWSFGCVLYETLTGNRLFAGETSSDIVVAILRDELTLNKLPEATPIGIRRLLERCLRQDATDRLRDIGDARIDIDEALSARPEAAMGVGAVPPAHWHIRRMMLTAAAVIAACVAGWFLHARAGARAAQVIRLLRLTDAVGLEESPAISPDGKSAVFVANSGRQTPNLAAASYWRNAVS